ncbi:methyltransferase, FkbM family [Singulisphaera sp. GP187]|nr:methyltransferase, FkbM family [Singulisphaera sp. GP187]
MNGPKFNGTYNGFKTAEWLLTVGFVTSNLKRMTLASILRFRNYKLRQASKHLSSTKLLRLNLKSPIRGNVWLRETGSDESTFSEICESEVYLPVVKRIRECNTILDIGGNVGLATRYFASRYPNSRIFTVEPDNNNFAMLARNTNHLVSEGRCQILQAALWSVEAELIASTPDDRKDAFDCISVRDAGPGEVGVVNGVTIQTLIEMTGFNRIDLLKIDVEGAEVVLFQNDTNWLNQVRNIAIEFHGTSREDMDFDRIVRSYGFEIDEGNSHTILAHRAP